MDINFQQLMAEAGEGFQPVPPGPYTVECEKAEAVRSSTQKPQIRVTMRILGGDHNGRKVFDQFTLTAGNPAALGFFFDNMAAFGLDRSFFAQLVMEDPMPYVAQMLLGRQCNIAVGIEPYQGVERNKVKQYRPIAGGQAPMQMPAAQGVPGFPQGAMPVAPQPQFQPQAPQGFPLQQQYPQQFQPQPPVAPQPPMPPQPPQMPQQGFPPVPQPQVPPVQEPAPWQQAAQQTMQQLPEQQYAPQPQQAPQPQPQPQQYAPQPQQQQQPAPIAPGDQQAQQQGAPMWQPSGPPPGYTDPNQPQQAPPAQSGPPPQYPQPPQQPQGVPPMPGVPGRSI